MDHGKCCRYMQDNKLSDLPDQAFAGLVQLRNLCVVFAFGILHWNSAHCCVVLAEISKAIRGRSIGSRVPRSGMDFRPA